MLDTLEGRHREVKQENFNTIIEIGVPLVQKATLDYNKQDQIKRLTTLNGNTINDCLLFISVSKTKGLLTLDDSHNSRLSQCTCTVYEEGSNIQLGFSIDTFQNEGIGLGSAMFHLGQAMLEKVASQFSDKTVIAFLVAKSKKRGSTDLNQWTSTIARQYGYSNTGELLSRFGYPENGDTFIKKIK